MVSPRRTSPGMSIIIRKPLHWVFHMHIWDTTNILNDSRSYPYYTSTGSPCSFKCCPLPFCITAIAECRVWLDLRGFCVLCWRVGWHARLSPMVSLDTSSQIPIYPTMWATQLVQSSWTQDRCSRTAVKSKLMTLDQVLLDAFIHIHGVHYL